MIFLPPPNDDENFGDGIWLHNLIDPKTGHHINSDTTWQRSIIQVGDNFCDDILRPTLWNAAKATELLREHKPTLMVLEGLEASNFTSTTHGLTLRKRLKTVLRDFGYQFCKEHYTRPNCFHPLTVEETTKAIFKAKNSFEKHLDLIVLWCMANFSQHRHLWGHLITPQPVDIMEYGEFTAECDKEFPVETVSKIPVKKQLTKDEIIAAKHRRKIVALKKAGKISTDVSDILYS